MSAVYNKEKVKEMKLGIATNCVEKLGLTNEQCDEMCCDQCRIDHFDKHFEAICKDENFNCAYGEDCRFTYRITGVHATGRCHTCILAIKDYIKPEFVDLFNKLGVRRDDK